MSTHAATQSKQTRHARDRGREALRRLFPVFRGDGNDTFESPAQCLRRHGTHNQRCCGGCVCWVRCVVCGSAPYPERAEQTDGLSTAYAPHTPGEGKRRFSAFLLNRFCLYMERGLSQDQGGRVLLCECGEHMLS